MPTSLSHCATALLVRLALLVLAGGAPLGQHHSLQPQQPLRVTYRAYPECTAAEVNLSMSTSTGLCDELTSQLGELTVADWVPYLRRLYGSSGFDHTTAAPSALDPARDFVWFYSWPELPFPELCLQVISGFTDSGCAVATSVLPGVAFTADPFDPRQLADSTDTWSCPPIAAASPLNLVAPSGFFVRRHPDGQSQPMHGHGAVEGVNGNVRKRVEVLHVCFNEVGVSWFWLAPGSGVFVDLEAAQVRASSAAKAL